MLLAGDLKMEAQLRLEIKGLKRLIKNTENLTEKKEPSLTSPRPITGVCTIKSESKSTNSNPA